MSLSLDYVSVKSFPETWTLMQLTTLLHLPTHTHTHTHTHTLWASVLEDFIWLSFPTLFCKVSIMIC